MRRLLLASVVGLTAFAFSTAADKPIEASNMPATYPVAVSVDGVKLKKNLTDLGVDVKKLIEEPKQKKNIDLENYSRLTMMLHLDPKADEVVLPAFCVTCKEAKAQEELKKVVDGDTETTIAGKKGLKGKSKMSREDLVGTLLNDKTMFFGAETAVAKSLSEGAKGGDLSTEFAKSDLNHDLVVVVAMKPLLAGLKEKYGDLDKLIPPQAETFWEAAKEMDTLSLTIDLAEETMLKGLVRTKNEAGADKVKEALQGAVALGSIALPQIKQGLGQQLPPEAVPAIAAVEAILKTSKFKTDGANVTWTVARPKNFGK
jgi:hypothetical protein